MSIDDTSTQVIAPVQPGKPRKKWHQRWAVRIPAALAVAVVGVAVLGATVKPPAAAPKAPATAKPSAPPAALTPVAVGINAWWSSTGHADADTVQADALKITGDFRGQTGQLAADGQRLADDAQQALTDWNAAYVAAASPDTPWNAPQGARIAQDFGTAMGWYRTAGQSLAATGDNGTYVGAIGVAKPALARVNATLVALHLPPSVAPSIDSPSA